ncbi:MAG: HAD-IC family P-type ATPase [Candidatus Enterosoma sp.]|nr:HAD-IC family P-type ATPase [Candidatus Enterosoma sp.]
MAFGKKKKKLNQDVPTPESELTIDKVEEENEEVEEVKEEKEEQEKQPLEVESTLETKKIPDDIQRFQPEIKDGLTEEQVNLRMEQGLDNKEKKESGKTTWQIIRDNVFTFFNMLLLAIGILLIVFGQYTQTIFLVIAFANTLIGIIQELKAKKTLAKLKLVTNSTVTVIRNGKESVISTTSLVLDDIYKLKNGDQIPTDSVVKDGMIEVNESLLTGESLPIKKLPGDKIFAGSFVVSGSAICKAEYVSEYNYISGIQSKAKEVNKPKSELVRSLNGVIKIIGLIIIPLGALTFLTQWIQNAQLLDDNWEIAKAAVSKMAGSMVGMIPSGMYLLTSIALANSVLALSKKNAMVQDLYSIEMLARVDTLCLDKTGTLTDGTMRVDEIVRISNEYDLDNLVGSYLNAFNETNQTSIALSKRFPLKNTYRIIDSIPFSSARKYSAVEFKQYGTFVLGAPEYLYKGRDKTLLDYISQKQSSGYRVVMLCKAENPIQNGTIKGKFTPVTIFTLEDHIRPEAPKTIEWFKENGVNIKIISGDNPLTASEIAMKCGVPNAEKCISLEGLSEREVSQIINEYTVFGRVTPDQKSFIIKTLKNEGQTVGMTGDGVNDILAMKTSDCSIAMANGASAARNVAHLVLLDSNFASMPLAVQEGRRCINNVQRSSALYLMKTIFTIVFTIIVLFTFVNGGKGIDYPFQTNNLLIMESVCIGLTSIFLALQKNDQPITGHFLRNTFKRAIPAAICLIGAMSINYILKYSGNFLELSEDPFVAKEQFTTFCSLTMTVVSLAMAYNCFLPITPLRKNWYRAVMFSVIFIIAVFAVFVFPFIPTFDGGSNMSQALFGINFLNLNKTMSLILIIYGSASSAILGALIHIFSHIKSDEKEVIQSLER